MTIDTIEKEIHSVDKKIIELGKEITEFQNKKTVVITPENMGKAEIIIEKRLHKLEELTNEFSEKATKVNFERFYKSLIALKEINLQIDSCPACGTNISQVKIHPYAKAQEELDLLKEISVLQSSHKRIDKQLKTHCIKLCINFIKIYQENFKKVYSSEYNYELQLEQLRQILKSKESAKEITFITASIEELRKNRGNIIEYLELIKSYELKNATVDSTHIINGEIERLKKILDALKIAKSSITNNEISLKKLIDVNSDFTQKAEKLKSIMSKESDYNSFINDVENGYKQFMKDLNNYKLEVESKQIHNIEQSVTRYYQEINKNDDDSEYITDVNFVLSGSLYKILVSFKDSTSRNSYACLSEGHLRSLGLSILLAVAEKNNVPFIIFDDVVNAIDSDHRANIIDMLFNNEFLKRTQQMITTHDRLFWERFCNTYSAKVNKNEVDKMSYVMNYTNKGTVLIQYNVGFEEKIINAFERYDIRQALVYCRIWFESLVTEYCVENGEALTGKFHRDRNNLLKPTLESIYSVFSTRFPGNENLTLIKADLINWAVQNQEHHSFNENGYNFVHSKSSNEVRKIFDAIQQLSIELFPKKEKARLTKRREQLIVLYDRYISRFDSEQFRSKAPIEIQENLRRTMEKNREELVAVERILSLISDPA
ncbi:MAG: hypothetical protein WD469_14815 [Paenibacillaceae bacterium]